MIKQTCCNYSVNHTAKLCQPIFSISICCAERAQTQSGPTLFYRSLMSNNDVVFILVDTVFGDNSADAGGGVHARMAAEDCPGIEHAVAADLNIVAEDRADLFAACFYELIAVFDNNEGLIALDVRRDGACAHMRLIAKYRIADVVIVRGLDTVEQDHVFKLR